MQPRPATRPLTNAPPSARPAEPPGFSLMQVFGIEIRLDWSLIVIFVLITFNLGAGLFPRLHPEWSPALSWVTALLCVRRMTLFPPGWTKKYTTTHAKMIKIVITAGLVVGLSSFSGIMR